LEGRIENSLRW